MSFITQKTNLVDCLEADAKKSGVQRELIIVEGESAAKSVVRVRDPRYQAVLPMQGKPMNATKASPASVRRNDLFVALLAALGFGWKCIDSERTRPGQLDSSEG